ncbi:hypothetical protein ACFX13_014670 [Malus domestica]|uniref:Uncharacterized protein n=1 Tax=Malus domestica TaxID=3750 RepID=A0A498I3K1_MALDO|nr:hypothetical protein DVH24_019642 [Malus domestica]
MSPTAVDAGPPITSPPPKPSATLTPDIRSSSTFNLGASDGNGSQCQFGSSVSSRSGWSRPRCRIGSAESGPGVNPFCSVNDCTSTSNGIVRNVDNGERRSDGIVGTSSCDDNLDKGEGESGGRVKILNCDERGQVDAWDGREVDKVEIVSLECGAKNNDLGSLLCCEKREFCENVRGTVSEVNWKAKIDTETECQKVDHMSFAFDSNNSGLVCI